MHTNPIDAPCGFDQRFIVENKDRPLHLERPHGAFFDEWDKYLNNSGVPKPSRATYIASHPEYETALGAYEWKLVHYLDASYGELYDLQKDPQELTNLWTDPGAAAQKAELLERLEDWRMGEA